MTSFTQRHKADFKGFVWLRGTGWNTLQTAEESVFHGALEFQPSWPGNDRSAWSACAIFNVSLLILQRHACHFENIQPYYPGKFKVVILEACPEIRRDLSSKPLCRVHPKCSFIKPKPASGLRASQIKISFRIERGSSHSSISVMCAINTVSEIPAWINKSACVFRSTAFSKQQPDGKKELMKREPWGKGNTRAVLWMTGCLLHSGKPKTMTF